MQVICVGICRSGTESLQQALLMLGYDYTYHGWDMMFDQPYYAQEWCKLARKKFYPDSGGDGDCNISAEEFDTLLGHAVAVTDLPASVFACEMIKAYPNAKIVLNVRKDLNAWHRSAVRHLCAIQENWFYWGLSWCSKGFFWTWHMMQRLYIPNLFKSPDGTLDAGIRRNGKWVYQEHTYMIRGLVPKENLLEWSVEDGWEPLCKFLEKDIPKDDFPRTNDAAAFKKREDAIVKLWIQAAFVNVAIAAAVMGIGGTLAWAWRADRLASTIQWCSRKVFWAWKPPNSMSAPVVAIFYRS